MTKFHSRKAALQQAPWAGAISNCLVICLHNISTNVTLTAIYPDPLASAKPLRKDSQSLAALLSEILLKNKVPETFRLTFWSPENFGPKKLA